MEAQSPGGHLMLAKNFYVEVEEGWVGCDDLAEADRFVGLLNLSGFKPTVLDSKGNEVDLLRTSGFLVQLPA
jgi:hypothetical protein